MAEFENEVVGTEEEQEQQTFTKEEVEKLVQSTADRRVAQALETQKKKYEKQISLSKLDDESRAKAEKDEKIAELERQLADFQTERNRSELKSVLSSRGLSAEFADIILVSEDIEASQENIDKLDKLFKQAVKTEVERRLASNGGIPKGNGSKSSELTKEEAKKLSMAELNRLAETQPELFDRLFKE